MILIKERQCHDRFGAESIFAALLAQLKWQDIIYDRHSKKKTYLKFVNGM